MLTVISLLQAFCDSSSDRSWTDALYSQSDRLSGGGYASGDRGTPGTPYSDPRTPAGTPFSDQLGGLVVGGGGPASRSSEPSTAAVFGGLSDLVGGGGGGDGVSLISTAASSSPHPHSPAGFGGLQRAATFPVHVTAAEFYYLDQRSSGEAALLGDGGGPARYWPSIAGSAAVDSTSTYLDASAQHGWPSEQRSIAGIEVESYLNGETNGGDGDGGLYGDSPRLAANDRPSSRASLRSSSSADSAVDENGGGVHLHHQHQHHQQQHPGFLNAGDGGGGVIRHFPVVAVLADSQLEAHQAGRNSSFTAEHCFTNFIE